MENISNYERIINMTMDEMALSGVKQLLVEVRNDCWMSLFDWTCYSTKQETIEHNKKWLEKGGANG